MENIKLRLTEDDVRDAQKHGLQNIVLCLLANSTGTLWRMSECGVGVELISPRRSFIISEESQKLWKEFQSEGKSKPCELEIELHPIELETPVQLDGNSRVERSLTTA